MTHQKFMFSDQRQKIQFVELFFQEACKISRIEILLTKDIYLSVLYQI